MMIILFLDKCCLPEFLNSEKKDQCFVGTHLLVHVC